METAYIPVVNSAASVATPTTLTLNQLLLNSTTLTYAATTNLDFNATAYQILALTGNVTFTTSNLGNGKTVTVKILADASSRTLTFPAWKFVGTKPTAVAAGKTGVLTVTAFGTTDADCVAAYAVEA